MFSNAFFFRVIKSWNCGKELSHYKTMPTLTLPKQSVVFTELQKKAFENIVGEGENVGNQHFSLFPPCFLPIKNRMNEWRYKACRQLGSISKTEIII